ncbi:class I SAM-dependent methyltransferase [Candidatus Poribacteria bacterium]|nr:class I SAM-dependent methyltransferase [Candidatus Poribacteria bacterium]
MRNDYRLQLQSFWNARVKSELEREEVNPKKQVHTDLLWREIKRYIGMKSGLTILDAGGGFGRFSIPLAEAGHKVVHFDISPNMLAAARNRSRSSGIANIEFVHGSIDDLSQFGHNSFDLVLCLDSPLSFCYDSYETALNELVRVTKSMLVLCVMNKSRIIAEGVNFDLKYFGRLKTAPEVYDTGTLLVTEELKQLHPTLMPGWHAFTPDELKDLLARNGCRVERMSAPGALAQFAEPDLLRQLFQDKEAYQSYLDFEERYDSDSYVLGMATGVAGGLLVTATKIVERGDEAGIEGQEW